MSDRTGLLHSFYAKMIFAAVVGFLGIASGIYVGYAIVEEKSPPRAPVLQSEVNEPFVTLDPGDLFPFEEYSDVAGKSGNFDSLLRGRNSLLLFVTFDCGPCIDFLKFWKLRMKDRLLSDVHVILCLSRRRGGIPPEYAGLVAGMQVVYYDEELWRERYHLVFWPMVVGVDTSGFVHHIQYGFEDFLDFELIEYFFQSSQ